MIRDTKLGAEELIIEKACSCAKQRRKSSNVVLRDWLHRYARGENRCTEPAWLMKELDYVNARRCYLRDELNAR